MDPEKHQSLISGLYVGIHTSEPPPTDTKMPINQIH